MKSRFTALDATLIGQLKVAPQISVQASVYMMERERDALGVREKDVNAMR